MKKSTVGNKQGINKKYTKSVKTKLDNLKIILDKYQVDPKDSLMILDSFAQELVKPEKE